MAEDPEVAAIRAGIRKKFNELEECRKLLRSQMTKDIEIRFWLGEKIRIQNRNRINRVIHKTMSHKTEEKMQKKMKMILQVDENLAHV